MANPLITVQNAIYGAPGREVVTVTEAVQKIFDDQHAADRNRLSFRLAPIGAPLFGLPAQPSGPRTFTIVYSLHEGTAGRSFMRAGRDGDGLTLVVRPERQVSVLRAIYATDAIGFDFTAQLNRYLADPGNSPTLTIGTPAFFAAITDSNDPAPGVVKYFSASYTAGNDQVRHVCGFDGQQVTVA
jgi:hypothetical protein